MVAWTDSSLNERLFRMVGMRISSTNFEPPDRFAADDPPVAVFLDFVESPHPRLFFEMEEPEPMSGTI
ncbi:hypothetical protein [Halobacterium salinarum]|uniref:hypothetical protein n=1 Tax=Halobacterium salinarum TaxID=2242 RepID=UPI0025534DDE|nr:hypothetical protein [Halobacterium salinarum]MDL0145246.1 hypothetical protein [Halobacterium salinarum]